MLHDAIITQSSIDDLESHVKDILKRLPQVMQADELMYIQQQYEIQAERDPLATDEQLRRRVFVAYLGNMEI